MKMKKTVVIVGAGVGLGNHIAEKFGMMGYHIILLARRKDALQQYKKELEEKGIACAWYAMDVSDQQDVEKTFEMIRHDYGTPDVLVYNVGVTTADKDTTIDADVLVKRYKTDVIGAYNCIQNIVTDDFASKQGTILVTGGGVALHPEYTFLPLSMDKAALRAMVYAMSPVLQEKGIYIGLVTICGGIKKGTHTDPALIADKFAEMCEKRDTVETIYQ